MEVHYPIQHVFNVHIRTWSRLLNKLLTICDRNPTQWVVIGFEIGHTVEMVGGIAFLPISHVTKFKPRTIPV